MPAHFTSAPCLISEAMCTTTRLFGQVKPCFSVSASAIWHSLRSSKIFMEGITCSKGRFNERA